MELRDFRRILVRGAILVLGACLAGIAVAVLVTVLATPRYVSTASVLVSSPSAGSSDAGGAGQDGTAASRSLASYASLVSAGDLPASASADEVTARVVPGTSLIEIEVTDTSAGSAQRIGRQVVQELAALVAQVETSPGSSSPVAKATTVSQPSLPTDPVSPDLTRNLLLGALIGLLVGLAAAVVRDLMGSVGRGDEEVAELVGAPVLADLPGEARSAGSPVQLALPAAPGPRSDALESLVGNLSYVDVDAGSKLYLLAGPGSGDGVTRTAVDIALTATRAGGRVVLVEGDLGIPRLAGLLGVDDLVGVTTVLQSKVAVAEAIQRHESGLHVLTGGPVPPNPEELLRSHTMGELLGLLRQDFDTVVVDAPGLLTGPGASLITQQSAGVVVVLPESTSRRQLGTAVRRLRAADARVLGVVITREPATGPAHGPAPVAEKVAAEPVVAPPAPPAPPVEVDQVTASSPFVFPEVTEEEGTQVDLAPVPGRRAARETPREAAEPERPRDDVSPLEDPALAETPPRTAEPDPDPLGPGFDVDAADRADDEPTPAFDETYGSGRPKSLQDDATELVAVVDVPGADDDADDDADDAADDDADDTGDTGEPEEDVPDEEERAGTLLDDFLTDEPELPENSSGEPDGDGPGDDGDRMSMWRPSRWIGS